MILINEFSGSKAAVLGLGRTGISVLNSLNNSGVDTVCWDDNLDARQQAKELGFNVENILHGANWAEFDLLIISPGISFLYPKPHDIVKKARQNNVRIDNDIGLFFSSIDKNYWEKFEKEPRIIGITGSNGKSTTAFLISHLIERAGIPSEIGGNFGKPVLSFNPFKDGEVKIIELSSYQTEVASTLKCDISVFLNFSPDHLERHGGAGGYFNAKQRLFTIGNSEQNIICVDNKEGEFLFEGFIIDTAAGEELTIVAVDRWNNSTEKNVKINVKLIEMKVAKGYEKLLPNKISVKKDKNKIAIIIGVEKYEYLTNLDAAFANRDANAFREYAVRALGVDPSNINLLVDKNASRPKILKALKLWLPKIGGENRDIYLFFAGHGLASDDGKNLYILPQDGDASLLEDTAITRNEIIKILQKTNPKSVTMFFDTCYSGQTRNEETLVASLRPVRIVADEKEIPNNFTIFTASANDQTSGSIEEAKHGMFSYYLMKGMEGAADENKDNKISNGELIAYIQNNVSKVAFSQNREQDPGMSGDKDKILFSYN